MLSGHGRSLTLKNVRSPRGSNLVGYANSQTHNRLSYRAAESLYYPDRKDFSAEVRNKFTYKQVTSLCTIGIILFHCSRYYIKNSFYFWMDLGLYHTHLVLLVCVSCSLYLPVCLSVHRSLGLYINFNLSLSLSPPRVDNRLCFSQNVFESAKEGQETDDGLFCIYHDNGNLTFTFPIIIMDMVIILL